MHMILTPLFLLPLIEIAGFVLIGGEIGLGLTVIWLIAATWAGFSILGARGKSALARAQRAQGDDLFAVDDLFDGICYVVASLLLIFPGFISDFIAIPFLLAPARRWLMRHIRANPTGYAGTVLRQGEKFTKSRSVSAVIEGEYKIIHKDGHDGKTD